MNSAAKVRESSTQTIAVSVPRLDEEVKQKRADRYRLLVFTEILLSFTDTDGDNIRLQKEGIAINEYVNDKLEIRSMQYFDIDVQARSYHDPTGRGWFRPSEDVPRIVRKRDLMFLERDFLARCLMIVCGLTESSAYQVMMTAHTEGMAVVGTYAFETAELYCAGLKAKGLSADIVPVEDGD
ncbi:clpS [Symbiodinium microadriaticum]|nr:clpS [Symbiodinium microadriaticum]